jgi:asparagine synthase (glutamine-hydrolysing)
LSSGIDSTIVAGLAALHTSKLRTFTLTYPDHPDMSEGRLAQESAKLFGAENIEVQISDRDAESAISHWLQSQDQPLAVGLNTYLVARGLRAEGVTVTLSGQGGDELFGGHSTFRRIPLAKGVIGKVSWLPKWLRRGLASGITVAKPASVRHKAMEMADSDGRVTDLYFLDRQILSSRELSSLGFNVSQLHLTNHFIPPEAMRSLLIDENDAIRSVSNLESRFLLGNMLLHDGDINCNAHGVEIRVPILDHRLLNFVLKLPGHILLPNGKADKYLLRTAFKTLLRPNITEHPKIGFSIPINRWMIGPSREICENSLAHLKSSGIVRPEGVDAIWRSFLKFPESWMWLRVLTLCALGSYIVRN